MKKNKNYKRFQLTGKTTKAICLRFQTVVVDMFVVIITFSAFLKFYC